MKAINQEMEKLDVENKKLDKNIFMLNQMKIGLINNMNDLSFQLFDINKELHEFIHGTSSISFDKSEIVTFTNIFDQLNLIKNSVNELKNYNLIKK